MEEILKLLYFFLPAYFANIAPVFVSKLVKNPFPLDFGKTHCGVRILGDHKTVQGFLGGILVGTIVGVIQYNFSSPNWLLYSGSGLTIGFLQGIGALAGDALKSYYKRMLKIKPGHPWIPFDQIDYTIGAILLSSLAFFVGWWQSIFLVVISALLHIAANHIGYWLRIRNVKW